MGSAKRIGSGAYSDVYRVKLKQPHKGYHFVAAKNVHRLEENEIHILKAVQHPNIVVFLAYFKEGFNSVIITELANESLRDRLTKDKSKISQYLQNKWIRESSEAIQWLHLNKIPDESGTRKPVVHRDIKAANCLLFDGEVLKLCDFGIAKVLDRSTETTVGGKGTEPYMAPELLNLSQAKFSTATDIYAYGVLCWEICTQEKPRIRFDERNNRLWGQPINNRIPEYLENLLPRCWKEDRHERPTIEDIISKLPHQPQQQ